MTQAFVLHTRPYRETSLLIELLTADDGRISAIARGAKRPKSPLKACLQMFTPLTVSYQGRSELQTLKLAETTATGFQLNGQALFCGLYLNEIIIHLLHRHEAHPEIFTLYQNSLQQLSAQTDFEPVLRSFELQLLKQLGYAINLETEAQSFDPIEPQLFYYWENHTGLCQAPTQQAGAGVFSGKDLLAFAKLDFSEAATRQTAKRLMRHVIQQLLGHKEIKSRELFQ